MLYGSFTRGEGDMFSDIDVVLFFVDETVKGIDQRTWVTQIAPVELYYINEFGNGTAIFDNLVRGEFHFDRATDMAKVDSWWENARFPSLDATLLIDRTGRLSQHLAPMIGPPVERATPERVQFLVSSLINWTLCGTNVLARGEVARAEQLLSLVHDHLLHLVRIAEHTTEHWPTPTRGLEQDISPASYARYRTCTAGVDRVALWQAYVATWEWGKELMHLLAAQYHVSLPETLVAKFDHIIRTQSHK